MKLKIAQILAEVPLSQRAFAQAVKKHTGLFICKSAFNEITACKRTPTREQKTAINATLKSLGLPQLGVWKKLSQLESDELPKCSSPSKPKPRGYRPVAQRILALRNITRDEIAEAIGYSNEPVKQIIQHGLTPAKKPLAEAIEKYLSEKYGLRTDNLWNKKENLMAGKRLTDAAVERFKIDRPGAMLPGIAPDDAIYKWPTWKDLYKSVYRGIYAQDTIAVIGPIGCGKSTLVNSAAREAIKDSRDLIKIIRPKCVDKSVIKISHLLEAICYQAGTKRPTGSHEQRSEQAFAALEAIVSQGHRPVLLIEEAHLLHERVIQTLKVFLEWEKEDDGRKILGIVLIAQEDIEKKMGLSVRQFWERCETLTFPALVPSRAGSRLNTNHIKGYIRHRLELAGANPDRVFEGNGLDVVAKRIADQGGDLPLIINNCLVGALNAAAGPGGNKITPEIAAGATAQQEVKAA